MQIHRILVLGVTFLVVGLCPRVDMALSVFALGMAVYLIMWLPDIFRRSD